MRLELVVVSDLGADEITADLEVAVVMLVLLLPSPFGIVRVRVLLLSEKP